jgi:nicotinamidase-related amidase
MTFRNGLDSLLRPEDSVLVLIDHQPYQLANLNSHDPQMVVNNSTALAKTAKAFGVPTILTSVIAERGGVIFPQITGVFPGQEVIDRTFINTWEDKKVVDAVRATGRKIEVPVDYAGWKIGNEFVVGYGMDAGERYRNLPYVGVLQEA